MHNDNDKAVITAWALLVLQRARAILSPSDGLAWLRYRAASDAYRHAVDTAVLRHPAGADA